MANNDEEFERLAEQYAEQVEAFKQFCIAPTSRARALEDLDWKDLSMGFFIALGVTGDSSGENDPYYDASMLSIYCRYRLQYWEGEWQ
jgi:hypothetical protein